MDITGHIALVTGGNKGIGFETAKQLGALGAVVIVGGRNPERVEEAVSGLKDGGVDAHSVTIDVTDDDSIAAAAESVANRFGRLDILMNNAGIAGGPGADVLPTDTDRAGLQEIFETNVYGSGDGVLCGLFRSSPTTRIVPPPRPWTQLLAPGVPSQVAAPSPQPDIPRSSFQVQWGCAGSTAAKYSSGGALRRYVVSPGACLPCSTPVGDSLAGGSRRRGRRFKSCHPAASVYKVGTGPNRAVHES